jgi:aspartyl-tRNA(Asn)/glutamyl-tRNA(Gln) amidotransferase subunit B
MTTTWETIIGLEVHAQLATNSKVWCGCSTDFGAPPNTQTCPICLGHPGTLPVLNQKVVEYAIKAGLALGCQIKEKSVFSRKNYFYPDLPKGYQISQFDLPICEWGTLDIGSGDKTKTVNVRRIHIEEDAAKNIHGAGGDHISVVDYNRGGTPLIEIVSEPDMRSAEEAIEYFKNLRTILLYLGINDGNMEEGNLRCDANVSVRPKGSTELRTRVELKNLNSFRFLKAAIEFEVARQIEAYENGEKIVQETRLYDNQKGETRSLRTKEEANDYRYFPEPDLLPLTVRESRVAEVRAMLPELPRAKAARYQKEFGVAAADAVTITAEIELAKYFETCLKHYTDGKRLGNWFVGELARVLNEKLTTLETLKFTPEQLGALLKLVDASTISNNAAKEVFAEMVVNGGEPAAIAKAKGLEQVSDTGPVESAADKVIAANPGEVEKYRGGKKALIGFFVGQVMKEMKGKGNPAVVNEVVKKKLEN